MSYYVLIPDSLINSRFIFYVDNVGLTVRRAVVAATQSPLLLMFKLSCSIAIISNNRNNQ